MKKNLLFSLSFLLSVSLIFVASKCNDDPAPPTFGNNAWTYTDITRADGSTTPALPANVEALKNGTITFQAPNTTYSITDGAGSPAASGTFTFSNGTLVLSPTGGSSETYNNVVFSGNKATMTRNLAAEGKTPFEVTYTLTRK